MPALGNVTTAVGAAATEGDVKNWLTSVYNYLVGLFGIDGTKATAIATLGAQSGRHGELAARVLAYLIAGHHAGLDDWHGGLKTRLVSSDAAKEYAESLPSAPQGVLHGHAPLNLTNAVPGSIGTPAAS